MKDSTLIISNHHRRSTMFEHFMTQVYDAGFKHIWIQDTGSEAIGKYQGPYEKYWGIGSVPYDRGMASFKQRLPSADYERILLIDNDCFVTPEAIERFITDFDKGDYDFGSHHIGADCYDESYQFDGCIAEVKHQKILPSDVYPGIVPEPHWENAFLLIKQGMWNRLSIDDVSHGRKYIAALVREKAKLGAQRAQYRLGYSHFENGWFHIGHLMAFIHAVEHGNLSQFSTDSELALSRLGFLWYQQDRFGNFYTTGMSNTLEKLKDLRSSAMLAWERLIKDTVLDKES